MEALRLQKECIVRGKDLFGRPAYIKFIPAQLAGWMFRDNGKGVPILPENVEYGRNNLVLAKGCKLHILEHLMVLKYLGLTNVCIESSSWPPYFGRTQEIWEAIESSCVPSGDDVQWCTTTENVAFYYPKKRAGKHAYTEIRDHDEKKLEVKIIVDYPGLGCGEINFCFPGNSLKYMFEARNQGWPSSRYYVSRFLSLLGWPHHNTAVWPQETPGKEDLIRKFIIHRAADLLGALALLGGDNLFAGRIVSVCSGHQADLEVIKKIQNKLHYL
jgi:UDP-3-O-acyl-N-acetylglucosamine deacetylase